MPSSSFEEPNEATVEGGVRRNEGVGRAEILHAKTLVPLAALGLGRSTRPRSVRGAPPRHAQPLRYPGAGRAPWKTGRSLNTVPFLDVLFWIFAFLGMENFL